jgi:putative ABC transport system permease protein
MGTFTRQKGKLLMIALTMALGVSLATAMLNVMMDVGDKVNQELKAYGANITIMPRNASIAAELYGSTEQNDYIPEEDLLKIKMIFWAHNIVDFAPILTAETNLGTDKVTLVGTWFDKHLELPTGESVDTGIINLRSWWEVNGDWLNDNELTSVMVGEALAKRHNIKVGDTVFLAARDFQVKSIIDGGGVDDERIFMPLKTVQEISGIYDKVEYVDVSALTTPENELARRAAQDPRSLSQSEWDTWYCTAYISSITYQLEEALPNVRAKTVLRVAESEGAILQKIQLLMLLLTILSLICSSLGISNLVTAGVMERSQELGLLKAVGAEDYEIALLVLSEIAITALIGGIAGYFAGLGFAQVIGYTVFDAQVSPKMVVVPIISLLTLAVALAGSLPALKMLMRLRPTEVLHGR